MTRNWVSAREKKIEKYFRKKIYYDRRKNHTAMEQSGDLSDHENGWACKSLARKSVVSFFEKSEKTNEKAVGDWYY